MANAQNIDKIFAEIAKKVQNEVMINLPRKVGVVAKNHFTDNFRKGGFVDSSLEPWQVTKRQQSGRGAEGKYTPLTSRRDHLMRSIVAHPRVGEVAIVNEVEYASIHNEGGVVNPKVTDKMPELLLVDEALAKNFCSEKRAERDNLLILICWQFTFGQRAQALLAYRILNHKKCFVKAPKCYFY